MSERVNSSTEEEKPIPEREDTSVIMMATNSNENVPRRSSPHFIAGEPNQAAGPSGDGAAPQKGAPSAARRLFTATANGTRNAIQNAPAPREKSPEVVARPKAMTISPIKSVSRKRSTDDRVKTLIFMDFETTGLFPGNSSVPNALKTSSNPADFASGLDKLIASTQTDGFPKITEMSFIAVPRHVFLKSVRNMADYVPRVESTASIKVRVSYNVHTRQVQPPFTEEQWKTYEAQRMRVPAITHSQEDLSSKNRFAIEWLQVRAFLDSCPKPACFVAHNGIAFDYRVLYGELSANGMIAQEETTIPKGILFIDSLLAFQKIEDQQKKELSALLNGINWTHVSSCAQKPPANGDHDYMSQRVAHDHPLHFLRKSEWSPAKLRRWTAEYFKKTSTGQWEMCNRYGFRLGELFKDIIKDKADFHYAQDDSEALLQIALAYGEDFMDYMDACAADFPF